MLGQEYKELARRMFEDYNAIQGDVSKAYAWVDKNYSPSIVFHGAISGDMNFEQLKQFHVAELALSPCFTLKHMIAEGNMVVTQFTLNATHQGTFMGIPATGKKFQIEGNMICSMKGSKCEEIWFYLDSLGFMKQLGAIPSQAVKK